MVAFPQERFWKMVQLGGECWLWTGALTSTGYGDFHVGKGSAHVFAHRFSYEMYNGPVGDGLVVMHTCDIPRCVRPEHLRVGTVADNQRDMAVKGRSGMLKLTDDQVRELRSLALRGGSTVSGLAKLFGISWPSAKRIILGVQRKYVV